MKKCFMFLLIAFVLSFTACLTSCTNNSDIIGIIGGADGPTAIFVSDCGSDAPPREEQIPVEPVEITADSVTNALKKFFDYRTESLLIAGGAFAERTVDDSTLPEAVILLESERTAALEQKCFGILKDGTVRADIRPRYEVLQYTVKDGYVYAYVIEYLHFIWEYSGIDTTCETNGSVPLIITLNAEDLSLVGFQSDEFEFTDFYTEMDYSVFNEERSLVAESFISALSENDWQKLSEMGAVDKDTNEPFVLSDIVTDVYYEYVSTELDMACNITLSDGIKQGIYVRFSESDGGYGINVIKGYFNAKWDETFDWLDFFSH